MEKLLIHHGRSASLLAYVTIIYNIFELSFCLIYAYFNSYVSLASFGIDSIAEIYCALIVIWRFKSGLNSKELNREKTSAIHMGTVFVMMALVTMIFAINHLIDKTLISSSVPGIFVSLISIVFMAFLWRFKNILAKKSGSVTILRDSQCSLFCLNLSLLLLASSTVNYFLPNLYWLDPITSIAFCIYMIQHGIFVIYHAVFNVKIHHNPHKKVLT